MLNIITKYWLCTLTWGSVTFAWVVAFVENNIWSPAAAVGYLVLVNLFILVLELVYESKSKKISIKLVAEKLKRLAGVIVLILMLLFVTRWAGHFFMGLGWLPDLVASGYAGFLVKDFLLATRVFGHRAERFVDFITQKTDLKLNNEKNSEPPAGEDQPS